MNAHLYLKDTLAHIHHIRTNIHIPFKLVIHCSNKLYPRLKSRLETQKDDFLCDVILNPDHFNKARFHGSLLKGILSNIRFAVERIPNISHFIIISTRGYFKEPLKDHKYILKMTRRYRAINEPYIRWNGNYYSNPNDDMHSEYMNALQACFPTNYSIVFGPHEGLTMPIESVLEILPMFDYDKVFELNIPLEECILQTLLHQNKLPHGYLSDFPHWNIPNDKKRILYKKYLLSCHNF